MATHAPPPSSTASSSTAPSGPQVLLLKLPTFVAEQLKRAAATSPNPTNVATLDVAYNAAGQQTVKLRYTPSDPSQPSEFIVRPRNKRQMLVFTEKQTTDDASTAAAQQPQQQPPSSSSTSSQLLPAPAAVPAPCKFLAAVSAIADVVPPDTEAYRALLSKRVQSQQAANEVRRMEDSEQMIITPQVQQEIEKRRRREEEKRERKGRDKDDRPAVGKEQKEGKRVRAERADVETALLRLFSENRFLTLKQLTEATQQPVGYLKEVVGDMCVRETKGDNKDKYQLKEKYRID